MGMGTTTKRSKKQGLQNLESGESHGDGQAAAGDRVEVISTRKFQRRSGCSADFEGVESRSVHARSGECFSRAGGSAA